MKRHTVLGVRIATSRTRFMLGNSHAHGDALIEQSPSGVWRVRTKLAVLDYYPTLPPPKYN